MNYLASDWTRTSDLTVTVPISNFGYTRFQHRPMSPAVLAITAQNRIASMATVGL